MISFVLYHGPLRPKRSLCRKCWIRIEIEYLNIPYAHKYYGNADAAVLTAVAVAVAVAVTVAVAVGFTAAASTAAAAPAFTVTQACMYKMSGRGSRSE